MLSSSLLTILFLLLVFIENTRIHLNARGNYYSLRYSDKIICEECFLFHSLLCVCCSELCLNFKSLKSDSIVIDRKSGSFTWRTKVDINMKESLLFKIISNNFCNN